MASLIDASWQKQADHARAAAMRKRPTIGAEGVRGKVAKWRQPSTKDPKP
ncbi:MAG TPA: hypothetical protein PKJ12_08575 [Ottowia sp.]|nr:hypothetical protein [Ottowia sp.]